LIDHLRETKDLFGNATPAEMPKAQKDSKISNFKNGPTGCTWAPSLYFFQKKQPAHYALYTERLHRVQGT